MRNQMERKRLLLIICVREHTIVMLVESVPKSPKHPEYFAGKEECNYHSSLCRERDWVRCILPPTKLYNASKVSFVIKLGGGGGGGCGGALLSVALAPSCKLLLSLGSHRMVITSRNSQQAIKNELWIILNLWLGPICQRPDQRTEQRRYTTNEALE